MMYDDPSANEEVRDVYQATEIRRRPVSGFVAGYHDLPYILVSPDDQNESHAVVVSGRIHVSPRIVIAPGQLREAFGDVFDPSTFDHELHARLFSFAVGRRKNIKLESQQFEVRNVDNRALEHIQRLEDDLAREENTRTGLIYGPRFDYYPVSIDRFVNEIVGREFQF